MTHNFPHISTNLAISADGKIAPVDRRPSGWTSETDHQRLRSLRLHADALLVGHGTLAADRMTLAVFPAALGSRRPPLRCIVSRRGLLSPDLPVFRRPGGEIHVLVTDPAAPTPELPAGVTVHRGSIAAFLATLATDYQVRHLHCEGGGELIASLAAIDRIDTFHLTLAGHTVFGGHQAPTATGIPGAFLPHASAFRLAHFEPRPELGECFLTYARA